MPLICDRSTSFKKAFSTVLDATPALVFSGAHGALVALDIIFAHWVMPHTKTVNRSTKPFRFEAVTCRALGLSEFKNSHVEFENAIAQFSNVITLIFPTSMQFKTLEHILRDLEANAQRSDTECLHVLLYLWYNYNRLHINPHIADLKTRLDNSLKITQCLATHAPHHISGWLALTQVYLHCSLLARTEKNWTEAELKKKSVHHIKIDFDDCVQKILLALNTAIEQEATQAFAAIALALFKQTFLHRSMTKAPDHTPEAIRLHWNNPLTHHLAAHPLRIPVQTFLDALEPHSDHHEPTAVKKMAAANAAPQALGTAQPNASGSKLTPISAPPTTTPTPPKAQKAPTTTAAPKAPIPDPIPNQKYSSSEEKHTTASTDLAVKSKSLKLSPDLDTTATAAKFQELLRPYLTHRNSDSLALKSLIRDSLIIHYIHEYSISNPLTPGDFLTPLEKNTLLVSLLQDYPPSDFFSASTLVLSPQTLWWLKFDLDYFQNSLPPSLFQVICLIVEPAASETGFASTVFLDHSRSKSTPSTPATPTTVHNFG